MRVIASITRGVNRVSLWDNGEVGIYRKTEKGFRCVAGDRLPGYRALKYTPRQIVVMIYNIARIPSTVTGAKRPLPLVMQLFGALCRDAASLRAVRVR